MKNLDFEKLNIKFIDSDNAWSYCPFHNDTIRPNFSISLREKYYGRYKCWACGKDGLLNNTQMALLNLSDSIRYKNYSQKSATKWQEFVYSCYNNLKRRPLLKLELTKQLNISTKSLDRWLVGYDGESFIIPMIREDLSKHYKDGSFCGAQRRFSNGDKRCVKDSCLGLIYPYNWVGDYYIFICEGFSDGINVWDLGLQSISRPHCHYTEGIEVLFMDILEDVERVVIIPDNDTVGIKGAEKLRGIIEGIPCNDDVGIDYISCDIFSFDGAKDIREYIKLKGKEVVGKELSKMI